MKINLIYPAICKVERSLTKAAPAVLMTHSNSDLSISSADEFGRCAISDSAANSILCIALIVSWGYPENPIAIGECSGSLKEIRKRSLLAVGYSQCPSIGTYVDFFKRHFRLEIYCCLADEQAASSRTAKKGKL